MSTLFKTVLDGMLDNNITNGSDFADWHLGSEAIDLYAPDGYPESPDYPEVRRAINRIIVAGGTDLSGEVVQREITRMNIFYSGKDFGDGELSLPFGG